VEKPFITPEPEKPVAVVPQVVVEQPVSSPDTSKKPKVKSTPDLKNIFNAQAAPEPKAPEPVIVINKSVSAAALRKVWEEYAEGHRKQVGEYQILQREFQFEPPVITLNLTNPVEESMLESFRHDLLQFLRDRLQNNELTILVAMQDNTGKKVIYTAKEKFEHLAEKNPFLNELKDRLGLDWEY